MKHLIVFLMMFVFFHHPTRPEWYRATLYRSEVTAMMMATTKGFT